MASGKDRILGKALVFKKANLLHGLQRHRCGLSKRFQADAMHRVFNHQAADVKPSTTEMRTAHLLFTC